MADPTRSQYERLPPGGSDLWDLGPGGSQLTLDFFPESPAPPPASSYFTADSLTGDISVSGLRLFYAASGVLLKAHAPPEGASEATMRLVSGVPTSVNVI